MKQKKKHLHHLHRGERKILIKHGMRKILPNSQIRPFTGSQSVFICLTGKNTMKAIESRQRGNKWNRGAYCSRGTGRTAHRVPLWYSGAVSRVIMTCTHSNLYPSLPVTDGRGAYWREKNSSHGVPFFLLPWKLNDETTPKSSI